MIGIIEVGFEEDSDAFHESISWAEPSNRSGRLGKVCPIDYLRCDVDRLRLELTAEFERVVAQIRSK